jgi:membrane protein DedA with SNARE-associated domain
MHSVILQYLEAWPPLGYVIIGLGMAIDGEPFLFAAAFLVYQDILHIIPTILVVFTMTVIGDICWYYLGTYFSYLPRPIKIWIEHLTGPFDHFLLAHPGKLMGISKFAYGIHHALWARAGALNLNLKKLIIIDIFATAVWIIIAGGLSYVFSASFNEVTRYIGYLEIGLLISLVIFVYVQQKIGKFVTNRLNEESK